MDKCFPSRRWTGNNFLDNCSWHQRNFGLADRNYWQFLQEEQCAKIIIRQMEYSSENGRAENIDVLYWFFRGCFTIFYLISAILKERPPLFPCWTGINMMWIYLYCLDFDLCNLSLSLSFQGKSEDEPPAPVPTCGVGIPPAAVWRATARRLCCDSSTCSHGSKSSLTNSWSVIAPLSNLSRRLWGRL